MPNESTLTEALVWKTIRKATKHGDDLFVETSDGSFRLSPWGDCCSSCYVQHVSGTDALAEGAVVAYVEDIDVEPRAEDEDCGGEVVDTWGHRITTSKGVCSIEMRLEHNGYYGGALQVTRVAGPIPGIALDDF
jgi:hypothetical protein